MFALLSKPKAYLDDSGGKDTGVVVFAGFVSTVHKWSKFEKEWDRALCEYPEIDPKAKDERRKKHIHMKELMHGNPPMSERRRDAIKYHLAHIAKQNTLFPISIAIDMAAYAEFQSVVVKNVDHYGRSAYSFCFQTALNILTKQLSQQGYDEDVAIVFDDGPQEEPISDLYSYIKAQNDPYSKRLASLTFMNDENTAPLQAADMVAWESHRYGVSESRRRCRNEQGGDSLGRSSSNQQFTCESQASKIGGTPKMTRVLRFLFDKPEFAKLARIWDSPTFTKMLDAFKKASLDGVPLELVQTPEGQMKAAEIFSRNRDKITLLGLSPEFWVPCQEAVLVEGKLYRKNNKKSRDSEPMRAPQSTTEILQ